MINTMLNTENQNQNQGCPSPMNTEFETVLTGLREQKDRNLPEVMRGEIGHIQNMQKVQTPLSPVATGPRMTGVVKWFNPTKGFGFITPDNPGLDVFVHQSEIQLPGFRSLAQGEPVEYQLYDGQKGPKALKVTGPQGKQVKGAPRQTKPKAEKAPEQSQVQSNLIKLASNYLQMNHVPVSTPVLAPTQALHALPSMISTPTPASQISHYFVAQPGLQNYYATASDLSTYDMATMPMSPTPMLIEGMPMSPQPQYLPMTPVGHQYTTTPTPFSFPNHHTMNHQNKQQFNVMNSPPQMPQTFDYGFQHHMQVVPHENAYDPNPNSFIEQTSMEMQISSPLSPIHC